jgi:hypothetical protein
VRGQKTFDFDNTAENSAFAHHDLSRASFIKRSKKVSLGQNILTGVFLNENLTPP